MRILISGAGIAGPTLAYWLARYGMTPTLVERAPGLRTGGYVIDFWGAGFEVASRMELLPDLIRAGYMVREVRVVDRNGRKVSGFPAAAFARAVSSGFTSLPRGDLAAAIYGALGDTTETIFGDTITHIDQTVDDVQVTFERHGPRSFDLVVGADGLHSRVRELVFGPEKQFERYLGIKVAAFEAEGYRPRDERVYMMCPQVGQEVSAFFDEERPHDVPLHVCRSRSAVTFRPGRSEGVVARAVRSRRLGMPADSGRARRDIRSVLRSGQPDRDERILGEGASHARWRRGLLRVAAGIRNRLFDLFSIGWVARLIAGRRFSDRIALPDY